MTNAWICGFLSNLLMNAIYPPSSPSIALLGAAVTLSWVIMIFGPRKHA